MNELASPYRFLHDNMAAEAYKVLRSHVDSENRKIGINHVNRSVAVFKWDDTKGMIGGVCGVVFPGWISLDLVWVEKPYRKKGIGSALLVQIEEEAVRMGAHSAYLWTQEFEAPDFYRKYGYEEFVRLDEFLPGHQLIGMKKMLLA